MRWTKSVPPKIGDTRIIKKFLFLPKRIGVDIRWLEFAYVFQQYVPETNYKIAHWADMYFTK